MFNAASDSASLKTWIIPEGTLSFKVVQCLWSCLQCLHMYIDTETGYLVFL